MREGHCLLIPKVCPLEAHQRTHQRLYFSYFPSIYLEMVMQREFSSVSETLRFVYMSSHRTHFIEHDRLH